MMGNPDIRDLIIFGTGFFAKTCRKYFDRFSDYRFQNFIFDNDSEGTEDFVHIDMVKKSYPPDKYKVFIAVGYTNMNTVREKYFKVFKDFGYEFASFVHPNVVWWNDTNIGPNSFIFENNVVQSNCRILDNVVLWSGNHVGHDTTIDCNSWITCHVVIYSNVHIGRNCFVGSNSNIKDDLKIGNFNFIGAGSNVWQSSEDYSFYPINRTKESILNKDIIMGLI